LSAGHGGDGAVEEDVLRGGLARRLPGAHTRPRFGST
jgi:hypothetical protein